MIQALKGWAKRHWPALRLRTILFSVLLFTAAMPGLTAIFLRVYENTLVRQTEAELASQSAALAATAQAEWPGAPPITLPADDDPDYFHQEQLTIDLSSTPVLEARPDPLAGGPADPLAVQAAKALGPIIETTRRTTLASIVLTDGQGRIVWGGKQGASYAALPEVRAALAGRPETLLRRYGSYRQRYAFEWLSRASDLRIHHTRPIVVGGKVVGVLLLSRSPRALFKGIYMDRYKIMLGIGGIFLLLIFMAAVVSRGVTRPIEALSRAARQAAEGRASTIPETPATAAIEIRTLYEDFRVMAEAIARRSRYLRDFAAAVSHEFKTPLAGIRGGVELLEDHYETMSPEERARFLSNISADTDRLSQLVTRLLDLARADMARPGGDVAVEVAAPIRRIADALATDGFKIEVKLEDHLPAVAVPEATLEAVLTALLENSRQAGAGTAWVEAHVEWGGTPSEDTGLALTVTDDGPGIPKADRDRLFEPFFTSRRAQGGTGLGLSIAQSLLAASKGGISLAESPSGTQFYLWLPLANPLAPRA
ncbi:MAG: two-component sensor histidine kinase [Caulobacter sp.]|nr:two-component sensor histidine kinase [Caulobacter sp.]